MIDDPFFYAIAVPAIIMIGLSKSGFLVGVSVLGVPLLALVIDPIKAAGILLPILIAMDAVGLWAYRRSFDRRNILILLPAGAAGVLIGYLMAAFVTEAHVRLIVGIVALAFTIDYWISLRTRAAARTAGRALGALCGAVAGFTSFVSHAGGPPVQIYLLPQRLPATVYAGTMVMLFSGINLMKVAPYFLLGQFSAENLATSTALLPIAPLAMFAGIKLVRLVPSEPFYRAAYLCLFFVSLKLIWDGVQGLAG
jgi:uncharacterized membrane protein YfcA